MKKLFGMLILSLLAISVVGCDKDNKDNINELTPEALYQTSWRGTGHCEAWTVKDRNIGIQFIGTKKGKVNWQDYDEFDITYKIEGKYIHCCPE